MTRSQRIIVISGASSGIGLYSTKHLSKLGNFIVAGARKSSDISMLSEIDNVQGVKLDVTEPVDIGAVVEYVETTYGYLDVLINNAGIPGWGAIMDREMDYFKKIMDVNLFGSLHMIKAFYPLLKKSNSLPIIINMSSQGGNYSFPFWAPYHMSKWALEALSDSLRRELLPMGIRVAVIQPGAIRSAAFTSQVDEFTAYSKQVKSEFQGRAISMLQTAFTNPNRKAKDPQVVADALAHAIYNSNCKLYYQPGKRLIPDFLAAKLPKRIVDKLLVTISSKEGTEHSDK